jgi:hypothetical protein
MSNLLINRNHWSSEDLIELQKLYSSKSHSELAIYFNRSLGGIKQKIKDLNLPPKKRHCEQWTKEEDNLIQILYKQKLSIKDIAKKLNRTPISVRLRANKKLSIFKSDIHLQENFRSKNFYTSLKDTLCRKTSGSKCCLCDYYLFIDLHHIDGNRKNHDIGNIASLCPNHHREVERGMHKNIQLYCIWWRIYSDRSISPYFDNKSLVNNSLGKH